MTCGSLREAPPTRDREAMSLYRPELLSVLG